MEPEKDQPSGVNSEKRKVILFIAVSLDGYIAGPGGDLSFLKIVEKKGEDYGYAEFIKNIDTVIIGRKTYDWIVRQVKDFPHSALDTYVITRNPLPDSGKTRFYNGNLYDLINNLKALPGKNIFIDGGAELVNKLLDAKLIEELIISVIPILLGDGTRLFRDNRPGQQLVLQSSRRFESGLIQLHYKVEPDLQRRPS